MGIPHVLLTSMFLDVRGEHFASVISCVVQTWEVEETPLAMLK